MWEVVAKLILRYRLAILLMLLLSSAFMLFHASKVRLSYQMAKILPADSKYYIDFEKFKNDFGDNGNTLVIGVENPNLFSLSEYNAWRKLSHDIKNVAGVENTISIDDIQLLEKDTVNKTFQLRSWHQNDVSSQENFDISVQHLLAQPFYKDLLFNPTNKTTLLLVSIDRSILKSSAREKLVEKIHHIGEEYSNKQNLTLHYSGLPYIRTVDSVQVKKEIFLFILLTLLITSLILYLFFRSFKATLVSVLVVVIGVIWSFGTMSLFNFEISILMGLVPPILIVIGIPNCIFLINKFHNEFRSHENKIKSITRIITKIGYVTLFTNLTTAAGFGSFLLTKSQTLQEFGLIASLNILLIFIFSLILIPISLSYFPPPKQKHTQHLDRKWVITFVATLIHLVQHKRKIIYSLTAILLLVGIFGITKIKTTGNLTDDLPKEGTLYKDLKFFEKNFGGVMPLEVIVKTQKKNGVLKLPVLEKIDRLQNYLDSFPDFSRPISVVDIVKYSKQSFYNGDTGFYAIPNSQERNWIYAYTQDMQAKKVFNQNVFMDSLKQSARISMQMADIGTPRLDSIMANLQPEIDSIFDKEKYQVTITGTSIVFLNGTKYLVKNLFTSLLLVIILIALFMSWLFRSFRMVMISLLPNIIPLLITAAIMGYFSIPIKPSTILVFGIAFGISVDDTIHFLAKYRQELKTRKGNIKKSVIAALEETGISMMYTSIVLFGGFFIFMASEFGGTKALGLLVSITLLLAMFSNLLLLPSFLLSLEKKITTKAFRESMSESLEDKKKN